MGMLGMLARHNRLACTTRSRNAACPGGSSACARVTAGVSSALSAATKLASKMRRALTAAMNSCTREPKPTKLHHLPGRCAPRQLAAHKAARESHAALARQPGVRRRPNLQQLLGVG
jgi:hypothetical protein